MRTTTLVLAGAFLALAAIAAPLGELSVVDTAAANSCTPYLSELDVKGYARCTDEQCNWEEFPDERPMCTD